MNTTEVVAIVTGASTLLAGAGAAALAWVLGRRDARHRARLEAYERLATAVQVLAFRATGIRMQGSVGSVMIETAQEQSKLLLVLGLLAVSKGAREFLGFPGAIALAQTLPAPQREPEAVTRVTLGQAFEELIAATGAVHLRGSQEARDKADVLLDACREYIRRTLVMPKSLDVIRGVFGGPEVKKPWLTPAELTALNEAIDKARNEFLGVARREENTFRQPR